jgi:glycosyltransferase involved in cell wall biosynthesis
MDRLIQNNANGILIDHPDPDAFAEQMDRLANNAGEWAGLARCAHRMSEGTSSWDDTIRMFLEVCSAYLPSSPQRMAHRTLSTARDWNGAQT